MIYNISGQQPFQVLADSFSVSPSESGYNLYLSADGVNYSQFAAVASGVTRQFTGMNNGNYYILSGNTSDVQVNWNRDCRGGGGGAAGVSSLDGQTGALTTKTINGNAILGEGDIEIEGGVAQYDLDSMSQSERAAFVAMCENLTELEREELFVYRDKSICRYDHTEGSGDSFKIGFFDYRQDGWNYPLTYFRHFFVKADGTYESLGNGSYPNVITFDTTYADTAHTLSNSDNLSPLIPISNLNAGSEGRVAINLRLIVQRSSPAKVVLSSKAWSERTGNLEGRICAEWHYSGNVITAVWNVVEHTATISSWTEVPEGGSAGGPTIVNLDALSQAELVELYNTLSGQTTASTVNIDYVFLKNFSAVHGDNQVPFKVQFIGLYTNKVRFYVPKGTTGHNGEIWNLYAEINSSGAIETSMQVNYGYQGLRRGDFSDSFYYNVDTEEFKLGSTTLSSGVTYEGIFDKNYYDNIYNGNGDGLNNQLYLSYYKLHITGSTVEETYTCPILSKKAVASTTIDGQTFNTRFFFDYGEYVLSFLVNTSGYKANPEIKYRANVVQISQSDYDALVAGGTVDSKTVYVII